MDDDPYTSLEMQSTSVNLMFLTVPGNFGRSCTLLIFVKQVLLQFIFK